MVQLELNFPKTLLDPLWLSVWAALTPVLSPSAVLDVMTNTRTQLVYGEMNPGP
jgi:hypothetical protein